MSMLGAKGLGHDEDKNASAEVIGIKSLLLERNQDYLAILGIRMLKLRNSP